jgi:hypothetical protein
MPVYEYLCNDCGPFTDMRPMAVDDQPLIPRVRRGGYSLIELGQFALAPSRSLPRQNSASSVRGSRSELSTVAIDGQILAVVELSRCHVAH